MKPEPKKEFKFSKETPAEIPSYHVFDVSGAGQIQLSSRPTAICGEAAGFHFGVSWTKRPFVGGVLGIDEAKRLANHILAECEKIESTESELKERLWKEYSVE